jgi:hypothetical protein
LASSVAATFRANAFANEIIVGNPESSLGNFGTIADAFVTSLQCETILDMLDADGQGHLYSSALSPAHTAPLRPATPDRMPLLKT